MKILSKRKKVTTAIFISAFLAACSGASTTDSGTDAGTDTGTDTDTGSGADTGNGTSTTTDINSGNWVINGTDERSTEIFEDDSNVGVLVNIQTVDEVTMDGVDYIAVESTGIPNYAVTVDQDLLDDLNARPKASTDFNGGSPSIAVGDVVEFGADIGYNSNTENCDTTGGQGYWAPGPSCPQGGETSVLFTTTPVEAEENCETGLGSIGLFSNGASIYDWNDGQSFSGAGVWQNVASVAEAYDVDICSGHNASEYHHHNYSSCLAEELEDLGDAHSPAYGVSADGFPVHGPWHSDGFLAISSWAQRDYDDASSESGCGVAGERTCLLVDQYDVTAGTTVASVEGPTTSESVTSLSSNQILALSGLYFQDNYHVPALTELGGAYLDEHNGHEHDDLGYHYHLTATQNADGNLSPVFPYTYGPTFKGELDDNALRSCSADTAGGGQGQGGQGGEGGEGGGGPPQ